MIFLYWTITFSCCCLTVEATFHLPMLPHMIPPQILSPPGLPILPHFKRKLLPPFAPFVGHRIPHLHHKIFNGKKVMLYPIPLRHKFISPLAPVVPIRPIIKRNVIPSIANTVELGSVVCPGCKAPSMPGTNSAVLGQTMGITVNRGSGVIHRPAVGPSVGGESRPVFEPTIRSSVGERSSAVLDSAIGSAVGGGSSSILEPSVEPAFGGGNAAVFEPSFGPAVDRVGGDIIGPSISPSVGRVSGAVLRQANGPAVGTVGGASRGAAIEPAVGTLHPGPAVVLGSNPAVIPGGNRVFTGRNINDNIISNAVGQRVAGMSNSNIIQPINNPNFDQRARTNVQGSPVDRSATAYMPALLERQTGQLAISRSNNNNYINNNLNRNFNRVENANIYMGRQRNSGFIGNRNNNNLNNFNSINNINNNNNIRESNTFNSNQESSLGLVRQTGNNNNRNNNLAGVDFIGHSAGSRQVVNFVDNRNLNNVGDMRNNRNPSFQVANGPVDRIVYNDQQTSTNRQLRTTNSLLNTLGAADLNNRLGNRNFNNVGDMSNNRNPGFQAANGPIERILNADQQTSTNRQLRETNSLLNTLGATDLNNRLGPAYDFAASNRGYMTNSRRMEGVNYNNRQGPGTTSEIAYANVNRNFGFTNAANQSAEANNAYMNNALNTNFNGRNAFNSLQRLGPKDIFRQTLTGRTLDFRDMGSQFGASNGGNRGSSPVIEISVNSDFPMGNFGVDITRNANMNGVLGSTAARNIAPVVGGTETNTGSNVISALGLDLANTPNSNPTPAVGLSAGPMVDSNIGSKIDLNAVSAIGSAAGSTADANSGTATVPNVMSAADPKRSSAPDPNIGPSIDPILGLVANQNAGPLIDSGTGPNARPLVGSMDGLNAGQSIDSVTGTMAGPAIDSVAGTMAGPAIDSVTGTMAGPSIDSVTGTMAGPAIDSVTGTLAGPAIDSVTGTMAGPSIDSVTGTMAGPAIDSVAGLNAGQSIDPNAGFSAISTNVGPLIIPNPGAATDPNAGPSIDSNAVRLGDLSVGPPTDPSSTLPVVDLNTGQTIDLKAGSFVDPNTNSAINRNVGDVNAGIVNQGVKTPAGAKSDPGTINLIELPSGSIGNDLGLNAPNGIQVFEVTSNMAGIPAGSTVHDLGPVDVFSVGKMGSSGNPSQNGNVQIVVLDGAQAGGLTRGDLLSGGRQQELGNTGTNNEAIGSAPVQIPARSIDMSGVGRLGDPVGSIPAGNTDVLGVFSLPTGVQLPNVPSSVSSIPDGIERAASARALARPPRMQ